MPHFVEVTDVGDAADAEVAPRHVGRHRQQAVPIQLAVLHLKKDNWAVGLDGRNRFRKQC